MNIDGHTRLLGLIGTPVGHSKSPAMYNYCFDKYGLNCAYLAFDIPMEKVEEAVNALRTFNVMGANVTMPLKNAVIPYLDEVSAASQAIGSVNTIVNKDGKLTGYVTDGMGYTGELRRGGVEIAGKTVTLLGAGGAASAIAIEAALEGAKEIRVFNKRDAFWERALNNLETIGKAAPACKISLNDLDDVEALRASIDSSDILTNATRVGMKPLDDQSLITDTSLFRPGLIVTDVVYDPEETKLLREAKAAGCKTFDGLGMLVEQGAASFKLYTGLDMPVAEVCDAIYR
ncbi:MAG TPA: shikimate dehydrogenase [Candidatus Scatomorpha merdigallinarum]|nr:shikimate dehydrogenase [Candidatus Scatomorpha merdigallinarum]